MRISNKISIVLVVGFLPAALICGLPLWSLAAHSIGLHYACGFFVLAISFALFATGKIGGGDAKLLASSAIWVGWDSLLDYLVVASFLGGALALFLLAMRKIPLPLVLLKHTWIARLHEPKGPVPFGVALGVGALIVYPETQIYLSALGG